MLSSSATCRLNSETSRVYLILVLVFVWTFAVCMLGQTVFQLVDFLCASIVFHPVIINKFVQARVAWCRFHLWLRGLRSSTSQSIVIKALLNCGCFSNWSSTPLPKRRRLSMASVAFVRPLQSTLIVDTTGLVGLRVILSGVVHIECMSKLAILTLKGFSCRLIVDKL